MCVRTATPVGAHLRARVAPAPVAPAHNQAAVGVAFAVAAYGAWGLLPLYFHALKDVGATQILAHRALSSTTRSSTWCSVGCSSASAFAPYNGPR